jgi:hypothetical protein
MFNAACLKPKLRSVSTLRATRRARSLCWWRLNSRLALVTACFNRANGSASCAWTSPSRTFAASTSAAAFAIDFLSAGNGASLLERSAFRSLSLLKRPRRFLQLYSPDLIVVQGFGQRCTVFTFPRSGQEFVPACCCITPDFLADSRLPVHLVSAEPPAGCAFCHCLKNYVNTTIA